MFRSRTTTAASRARAARELERQIMTMEVVSGDEDCSDAAAPAAAAPAANAQQPIELPNRLVFGPYGITPLLGLHYDAEKDTATS